jgi:hypothetical protein
MFCYDVNALTSSTIFPGILFYTVLELFHNSKEQLFLYCIRIVITVFYYIDRCELWGFIREINSGISHVKYQFFPTVTTFTQL